MVLLCVCLNDSQKDTVQKKYVRVLKRGVFIGLGRSGWNAEGVNYRHRLLVESAAC